MARTANGYAGSQDWIGFHDDMFPQDTDNGEDWSFLAVLRKAKRDENWRVAGVGGEMVPGKASKWLGAGYEKTTTMLKRAHFSWVGPYCPALEKSPNREFKNRSESLVRQMGYEFRLTEITHPKRCKTNEPFRISLKGKNIGVAPFYYPWSVELALLNSTGKVIDLHKTDWDIRTWQPGEFAEKTNGKFKVAPGTYRLALGIRDPWQNRPAVQFANDLPMVEGWAVISTIEVVK